MEKNSNEMHDRSCFGSSECLCVCVHVDERWIAQVAIREFHTDSAVGDFFFVEYDFVCKSLNPKHLRRKVPPPRWTFNILQRTKIKTNENRHFCADGKFIEWQNPMKKENKKQAEKMRAKRKRKQNRMRTIDVYGHFIDQMYSDDNFELLQMIL